MNKQRRIRCELIHPTARNPRASVWMAAIALLFGAWFALATPLYGLQPTTDPIAIDNAPAAARSESSQPLIANESTPASPTGTTSLGAQPASAPATNSTDASITPANRFGLWTLAPALVAILIAIITRQVLLALPLGILTASAMLLYGTPDFRNPIWWVTHSIDKYLFGVLASADDGGNVDYSNLKILMFTLFIGAMIGIIEVNGGTRAMVARVTRHLGTRRRGQLGAWFAGIVVFFDDYANAMIVGPSMRPVFDRLKISREKLAYIVDSTAAPVASVFIGTWLVAEISFIDKGLGALSGARPAFLVGMSGFDAFWASLPYRTYAWLALAMVFILAMTGRDFGSMLTAETRAANADNNNAADNQHREEEGRRWWLGAIPVAIMVFGTIALLALSGWTAFKAGHGEMTDEDLLHWSTASTKFGEILGSADSATALLYAAFIGTITALLLTMISRACSLAAAMDGMVEGMKRMFAACIVLTLAWGLTQAGKDLQLSVVAADTLKAMEANGTFDSMLLPLATFIAASIVSFATGTSWGTMGILCPAVVAISARLYADIPPADALPLFYATIGAVLTGAVFGDHCSPISDTTVLSSIASECDLGRHVWTQMPYAFVVALVGILTTDLTYYALAQWMPTFHASIKHWFVYPGTLMGAVVLTLIVFVIGRKPKILQPAPMRPNVLEATPTNS